MDNFGGQSGRIQPCCFIRPKLQSSRSGLKLCSLLARVSKATTRLFIRNVGFRQPRALQSFGKLKNQWFFFFFFFSFGTYLCSLFVQNQVHHATGWQLLKSCPQSAAGSCLSVCYRIWMANIREEESSCTQCWARSCALVLQHQGSSIQDLFILQYGHELVTGMAWCNRETQQKGSMWDGPRVLRGVGLDAFALLLKFLMCAWNPWPCSLQYSSRAANSSFCLEYHPHSIAE